jgi:uncharacterized cupin superfamily protein
VKTFNILNAPFTYDDGDPDGFHAGYTRIGPAIGAKDIGATIYELPAGQSNCPYHYEYGAEEWLLVVSGTVTVRHPEGEDTLREGDIVCFPEGPDGAHRLINRGDQTARAIVFSTRNPIGAAVYPDSDKIGIWVGNEADHVMVRRDSNVDYWDGET